MNKAEYEALCDPLSNDARTLYLLGLRPIANAVTGLTEPLNYKQLMLLLNARQIKFTRGRQLNLLIKELIAIGLVHLPGNADIKHSLNGTRLTLPILSDGHEAPSFIQDKYPLHRDWQPDANVYADICALIGIIDTQFSDEELGEFIAYWLGRPDTLLSDYQWNQRFAQQIKRKHTATETAQLKQIGTQTQSVAVSSLEADDNAKRLVAKYKQSRKKNQV